MGIFEIMGAAVLFGFCSVFGWNTGQIIWDTKIDPDKKIEKAIITNSEKNPTAPESANK
jgi:hypothetical protein